MAKQTPQKKIASKRMELLSAYKEVFASPAGKKVLYDLMKQFNVLDSTFSSDANEMFFNEGARTVVLRIFKTINVDPKQLEQLYLLGQSEENYAYESTEFNA